MSTNSTISALINGRIKTIYCHWDGYLSNNGRALLEDYTTQEKVEQLLDLGWLSILDKDPGIPPVEHTFDNHVEGYCVAYRRDRGEGRPLDEDYNKGQWYGSWEAALEDRREEYNYYWDGAKWFVDTWKLGEGKCCEVTDELIIKIND